MINKITQMHEMFGITHREADFGSEERLFRIGAMLEELSEFTTSKTKEDELDALVDLVVFALGTAERMGYAGVFEQAFNRVMASNMSKTLGANTSEVRLRLTWLKGRTLSPRHLQT